MRLFLVHGFLVHGSLVHGAATLLLAAMALSAHGAEPKQREREQTMLQFSHVVAEDADFYLTGPQQGRPPDGVLQAGTRVQLLKQAGSYALVKSRRGVRAYVSADSLREAPYAPPGEDEAQVAASVNEFAWDLYERLAGEERGNLFCSPLSIWLALSMTSAGARGQTEEQMAQVLRVALPEDRLHAAAGTLQRSLTAGDLPRGFSLHLANRLWGQQGCDFLPAFLAVTREHYAADLAAVDFAAQAEAARQEINAWVAQRTAEKIQELIARGVLSSATVLVLTNAIYFKGDWSEKFDPKLTEIAPFHVGAAEQVQVPLMQKTDQLRYFQAPGVQVLELPYGNEDLAMVLLLPDRPDGLAALEQHLNADELAQWLRSLRNRKVALALPRFKLESQFQLNEVLKAMGMTLPFDAGQADFSGMSSSERLFISAVLHKAFVDVNEEGTEAAAATAVIVERTSIVEPVAFRADHPFLFLIRDTRSGAILFLGRLVRPEAAG